MRGGARQRLGARTGRVLLLLGLVGLLAAPTALLASAPGHGGTAVMPSPPVGSSPSVRAEAGVSPHWSTPRFFSDVGVAVSIPGVYPTPDINFGEVPQFNAVPENSLGLWVNISTDVSITQASLFIWGTEWGSNASNPLYIQGFDPSRPTQLAMFPNPATGNTTASLWLDDYKYFWPGSTVSFNITVTSVKASPSQIWSAREISENESYNNNTVVNYATWTYTVLGPFASTNFTNDIAVRTTPDVLSRPSFAPNPFQPLQVTISALPFVNLENNTISAPNAIPKAQIEFVLNRGAGSITNFNVSFGPDNHTVMSLATPIGPYPLTNVSFQITAYLPWQGFNHAIDLITSPWYSFNWSTRGEWWHANEGLEANCHLSSNPDVLTASPNVLLQTATQVNVTILCPIQNVTLGSAELDYRFSDGLGTHSGALTLRAITNNESSVLLPGLPNGSRLTFLLEAKDSYGTPVTSANYTYSEGGNLVGTTVSSGLFFFEALDVAGTGLVPSVNFTLANSTWTESGVGTSLGFGGPFVPGVLPRPTYLRLAYGTYLLSVHAFGKVENATVIIAGGIPPTIVFYFASGPIPPTATSGVTPFTVGEIAGLGGALASILMIMPWWLDRRRKAEAEQKRISL